ncbi:hypothetical protein NPIL_446141 [Nephila pilipes]|uniref:Uncharacterized protein n=1 Tax=Nephila pilipes TaxID=299642 RepID=A0A8X6MTD5_NEPPI|nr:hypothetical protein NPIL_446141 [Nephila pilipes]
MKFLGLSKTLILVLVLTKNSGEVFIVAFEDRYTSLASARQNKIDVYLSIVEHLRREGKTAQTAGDCLPGPVSKHRLSLPKELSREAYSGLDDCSEASLL